MGRIGGDIAVKESWLFEFRPRSRLGRLPYCYTDRLRLQVGVKVGIVVEVCLTGCWRLYSFL